MIAKVAIVSLNFRAAHISHLVASYKQMQDLGYEPICLINEKAIDFLPKDIKYTTKINEVLEVDYAIIWFPSKRNINLMIKLKRRRKKILYVFHEPVEKFSIYIKAGNSYKWTIKFYMKYLVSLVFLLLSNKIILPSNKALKLYNDGFSKYCNKNIEYLPLLYCNERANQKNSRLYFSYIGTVGPDHAFDRYIDFIYELYRCKYIKQLKFLIATRYILAQDERLDEMQNAGILKIVSGKPMTDAEINGYYASSYLVWNAYNRTTQSGVLAKAFMFGTPGLVMKNNLSEFVKDGREVIAVSSNDDFDELKNAVETVMDNFSIFSEEARANFERNYYYKVHNDRMAEILKSL